MVYLVEAECDVCREIKKNVDIATKECIGCRIKKIKKEIERCESKQELIEIQCDSVGCRVKSIIVADEYFRIEYPDYKNIKSYTCPVCNGVVFDIKIGDEK